MVIRRLREIDFIDSKNTHPVKLAVSTKNDSGGNTEGSFGIKTIINAQQFTVNIQTS